MNHIAHKKSTSDLSITSIAINHRRHISVYISCRDVIRRATSSALGHYRDHRKRFPFHRIAIHVKIYFSSFAGRLASPQIFSSDGKGFKRVEIANLSFPCRVIFCTNVQCFLLRSPHLEHKYSIEFDQLI